MKITELKKQYPSVKFYELKEQPENSKFVLKKIEDLLDLEKNISYFEINVSSEMAREITLKSMMDAYIDQLSYADGRVFANYLEEHISTKLDKLIQHKPYTVLCLYGLGCDVMCEEDNNERFIDEDSFNAGMKEIDNLHKNFEQELSAKMETRRIGIMNCIMSYKDKYKQATTKSEQEEIIRKIQFELKDKYGLDGRSDGRASKVFIKTQFETD